MWPLVGIWIEDLGGFETIYCGGFYVIRPLIDALMVVRTVKQNDTEEMISWRP